MHMRIPVHRWVMLAAGAALAVAAVLALPAAPASATGHSNLNTGVQAFVAMLDSADEPIAPNAFGRYAITPVSGSATTVKVRVYMVKEARTSLPAASDYARYGDFSYIYMGIAAGSGSDIWNALTGATWSDTSLCSDQTGFYGAGGEDCNLEKSKWIANARAADSRIRASDVQAGDRVHPLDFTITVPDGANSFAFASLTDCRSDATACSHEGNPDNNQAAQNRIRNQAAQVFSSHTNVHTGVRAFVARLDSNDEPIASFANGVYSIKPVDGAATTLKLRVYLVREARTSLPAPGDYARYGDFSFIYMGIAVGPGIWGPLTGATWSDSSLCDDQTGFHGSSGSTDCNLGKAKWIANAMAADSGIQASDTETDDPVHPLDFTITVPAGTTSFVFGSLTDCRADATACSYAGNPDNNQAAQNRIRNAGNQNFNETVFQAHIYRYQPAFYAVREDGSINWGDVSSTMDATHTYRSAQLCTEAHVTVGNAAYDAASDCNRAVKVGEAIYLPNTLLVQPGAARNGNAWLDATGSSRVTYGQYDTVTLSVLNDAGFVGINTFCPVDVAAHDGDVEPRYSPRDRTGAALASCTWRSTVADAAGTTLWNGDGALFFPTGTGTVLATVTFAKEDDPDTAWDDSFSASDTITIEVTDTDAEPIKAYLGRRKLDNALSLQIGRKYMDGVPSQWGFGPVTEPGGEGYVAGATYADVDENAAVVLTVPSGRLELLGQSGVVKSCNAERGPCTLTISRADLKAAARAGWTGSAAAAIGDEAHIYLSKLRYAHAPGATEDVEISGVLKLDDGSTESFSYTAKASAGSAPAVAGYPRGDADRLLAPGQSAAVSLGYHVPAAGAGDPWRLLRPVPGVWGVSSYVGPELNSRLRVVQDTSVRSGPSPAAVAGSYLQITGPASWAVNGGRRLSLDRTYGDKTYDHFSCVASTAVESGADADSSACFVTDSEGNAPVIEIDADAAEDVIITASLPLWTLNAEEAQGAAGGMPLGTEAHRDSVWHQRFEAFGSATFKVQTVGQLSRITLGRQPNADLSVPTAPVRINGSAGVRLALLNENGVASQLSSVSAITVTVIGGGTLNGLGCVNLSSCTFEADTGALFDAVQSDPAKTAKIDLTFNAPKDPGTASIEATVVGIDGSTFSERLALTISGSATEIASSGEMPRVHSSATENDDRDEIKIPISASDASGNAARMPTNAAAVVRGIDGAVVPAGRLTSEVICTDEMRLRCNVEIAVTAAAASPLASGAYTAAVTGSGIGSTEVGFAVAGPAETLSIAIPEQLPGLGLPFTATASVVDKDGIPVADGTWVRFEAISRGTAAASAILGAPPETDVDHDNDAETPTVRQRRAPTKNGEAGASVVVVGEGIAILAATAGGKSANVPIDTRAADDEAAATGPALEYGTPDRQPAASSWATYRGSAATSAAELLAQGPANANVVWLWNGVEWIRYGESGGTQLPGSQAFTVTSGDVLWFGE